PGAARDQVSDGEVGHRFSGAATRAARAASSEGARRRSDSDHTDVSVALSLNLAYTWTSALRSSNAQDNDFGGSPRVRRMAGRGRDTDVYEGRRADPLQELCGVPPADDVRADVAAHVRRCAAVRAVHQAARHVARDA